MDTQLLLALLASPLVAAGFIVAVAIARRRSGVADAAREPVHRLQADSATVQDSVVRAPVAPPARPSGRARRAASAGTPEDH